GDECRRNVTGPVLIESFEILQQRFNLGIIPNRIQWIFAARPTPPAIRAVGKGSQHAGEWLIPCGPVRTRFSRIGDQSGKTVSHYKSCHGHLIHFLEAIEKALPNSRNSGACLYRAPDDPPGITICIPHSIANEDDVVAGY